MTHEAITRWTHFYIDEHLPGSGWGTGGIGLGDFNGDGKLEVAISRRQPRTAYWYERKNDQAWVQHIIGQAEGLENTLGAAVLDIDGDGWLDIAFSRVWFRNPGCLVSRPDTPWEAHAYDGGGHDVVAADINGDGRLDLVTYDGKLLAWFDTARELMRTVIVVDGTHHGGIAPQGVGDLNGDGHPDIVVPGYWYENPGSGYGIWKRHTWPHVAVSSGVLRHQHARLGC